VRTSREAVSYGWLEMIELESVSEATLVVAIARSHEPALAEAYRRQGGAVESRAGRVLGTAVAAEDTAAPSITLARGTPAMPGRSATHAWSPPPVMNATPGTFSQRPGQTGGGNPA
jgi:hypothetical protein